MKLVLFLTYGVSLKKWFELGLLNREVALYKELCARGHEVAFFTYGDESDHDFAAAVAPIKVIPAYARVRRSRNRYVRYLKSLILPFFFKEMREVAILKTNQMWGSWVALVSKFLYKKKLLVRCGYEQFDFARRMKMPCWFTFPVYLNSVITYHMADAIMISSEVGKRAIARYFKKSGKQVNVIHNYVDVNKFAVTNQGRSIELLFVGRLEPQKNVLQFLEAIKGLRVACTMIGDGTLREDVVRFIKENQLNVFLHKPMTHDALVTHYATHKIYVLPSHFEGMPKTLIEAMASGCAVVASRREGLEEFVVHGETGLLCETEADSIRKALTVLLSDDEYVENLAANAQEWVRNNVSLDIVANREESVYKQLMETV